MEQKGMKAIATKIASKTSSLYRRLTTALLAVSVTPLAMAGGGSSASTLGTAASGELTGAEGIVLGILVTLIGVVVLFTVYSLIKRASGKA